MEAIFEFLMGWGITPEMFYTIVTALVIVGIQRYKNGKYKKYLNAAVKTARIAYSAIESVDHKVAKTKVQNAVNALKDDDLTKEVSAIIHAVVDSKRAKKINRGKLIPIKRFWRNLLKKQILTGVALKIVSNVAIKNTLGIK